MNKGGGTLKQDCEERSDDQSCFRVKIRVSEANDNLDLVKSSEQSERDFTKSPRLGLCLQNKSVLRNGGATAPTPERAKRVRNDTPRRAKPQKQNQNPNPTQQLRRKQKAVLCEQKGGRGGWWWGFFGLEKIPSYRASKCGFSTQLTLRPPLLWCLNLVNISSSRIKKEPAISKE